MTRKQTKTMIDEARELYLQYEGRKHQQIFHEMRSRGWPFYRKLLYSSQDRQRIGWPEQFGWVEMLSEESRNWLSRMKEHRSKNFPAWEWGWKYQRYIYERLARVTSGETKRLMIFMPPRHGKSEMVTIRYAAWRLLQDPKLNLILGSYNQRLADKFSRRIKRIVSEPTALAGGTEATVDEGGVTAGRSVSACVPPAYAGGSDMKRRLNTASEWETAGGGVVRSVGVGAGIAGFGAGLVVIDDPVRNRADAESETYRERVWDWFNDDIYTRQ